MNQTGAAVLGALITLTPGSSALDIDFEKREILLHILDKSTAHDSIAAIRRDFEQEVCLLFPEKKS